MSEPETPPAVARDVRVDHIGLVAELQKQFADTLKTRVKLRMYGEGLHRVEGDLFDGLYVEGEKRTIRPDALLRLYERKRITRAQFLSALRVSIEPATAFLSVGDILKLSDVAPAEPQLRVTRKKGVAVELVDAVRTLAAAVAEPA